MEIEFEAVICKRSQMVQGRRYIKVSGQRVVREVDARPAWLVDAEGRVHPRGVRYHAPAAARAVVHAVERPGSVVAGFSALALYGLPYLVEGADTTLLARVERNEVATSLTPTVRRLRRGSITIREAKHRGVRLQVASPADATVQALGGLRRGEHSWQVEQIAGLNYLDTRAIQLVDCVRRHLGLTPEAIRNAARGKIDRRWLESILAKSSMYADSPKETELRLMFAAVAEKYGLTLEEQVPLIERGRIVTVFDLAFRELKIGLMYDGGHHWEYQQRQKDALINLVSTLHGWTVARASSATMQRCVEVVSRIIAQKLAGDR